MKVKLFLLCLLGLVPCLCVADSVPLGDPRVQSGGSNGAPTGIAVGLHSIPVFTTTFSFNITFPPHGTQVISPTFVNMTGATIYKVTITPGFGAYTTGNVGNSCSINNGFFTKCTFPTTDNGSWTFFGGPGIPQHIPHVSGGEFDFSFFGFNQGTFPINAQLSLVPEPGTFLLLAPALAGLWTKRKAFLR